MSTYISYAHCVNCNESKLSDNRKDRYQCLPA